MAVATIGNSLFWRLAQRIRLCRGRPRTAIRISNSRIPSPFVTVATNRFAYRQDISGRLQPDLDTGRSALSDAQQAIIDQVQRGTVVDLSVMVVKSAGRTNASWKFPISTGGPTSTNGPLPFTATNSPGSTVVRTLSRRIGHTEPERRRHLSVHDLARLQFQQQPVPAILYPCIHADRTHADDGRSVRANQSRRLHGSLCTCATSSSAIPALRGVSAVRGSYGTINGVPANLPTDTWPLAGSRSPEKCADSMEVGLPRLMAHSTRPFTTRRKRSTLGNDINVTNDPSFPAPFQLRKERDLPREGHDERLSPHFRLFRATFRFNTATDISYYAQNGQTNAHGYNNDIVVGGYIHLLPRFQRAGDRLYAERQEVRSRRLTDANPYLYTSATPHGSIPSATE